ncbi:RE1 [Symbiodinium sp. CCMP2592]|nr:RE1 [Symbiodinium sp. CCMP2592]
MIMDEVKRQVAMAMQGQRNHKEALEEILLVSVEVLAGILVIQHLVCCVLQYRAEGESRDSEMKGSVELPPMPEVTADSAVSFSDWLYETEQAVGGLSDRAASWFSMCLKCARENYEVYQMSDPWARLTLEPMRPPELQDERWSRLERRVLTLLLATLQRQAKDDAVTHRISNVSGLLFRLHVLYAPGGSAERGGVDTFNEQTRCMKPSLPTLENVLKYYNHVLAELQQAAPARSQGSQGTNVNPDGTKLKGMNATTNGAGTGESGSPSRRAGDTSPATGKVPSRFFASDNGCTKGQACKFDHTLPNKEAKKSRCWFCGSTKHVQKECPVKSGKPVSPTRGRPTTTSTTSSTTNPTLNQVTAQQQQAIMESIQAVMGAAATSTTSATPGTLTAVPTETSTATPSTPAIPVTSSDMSTASTLDHPGNDERTQEIGALLQQANAMLNRLTRLQALQVSSDRTLKELAAQMAGLGFAEEERMALLDSDASHPFRERALHETDGVPVRVELAGGQSVTLKQNKAGTLLPTTDAENAQDLSTILPMGALVQTLGCELSWSKKNGLRIVHPQFGTLKTVVRGNCPLLGETQALDLIHQLEQKKLQELREATAETFLGTLSLSEVKDWDEMFAAYVQSGNRAHLLQALESPGCPLQGLDESMRSMLAVGVDLSDEAGARYLKALPIRSSQRKCLLTKRWMVRLFERDNETSEDLKRMETNSEVLVNFNLNRSKMFNLKGDSAAYKALVWAACRGQIEGVCGSPPSNSCLELFSRQLLIWMLAKEGARVNHRVSPYLVTTSSPTSRMWTTTVWQGFQREYQLPASYVSPEGANEAYCLATNLILSGGDDPGWGPQVDPTSSSSRTWSRSFVRMIASGVERWRKRPEPLVLCSGAVPDSPWGPEELRKWRRHVANGHLPYNKRCRTCIETAATGRSHRRVIAPNCYTLGLDLCGPFRVHGETADAKGYRYALVGVYTMPKLQGFRDYKIPEDEEGEGDDGCGVGEIPVEEEPDFLVEGDEVQPDVSREDREEMDKANADFAKLFREIGDTLEYQNLHYMIPLKSRKAPKVEAAIRLLYVQIRSEGLSVQRVHSDRARELRGHGIRQWLLEREVYPTTGEAQVPQSNGKAEQVVKALKRRAKTLLQTSSLPRSCWPLAMGHAAWAQRETALGRGAQIVPFGAPVAIKAKVFGVGGKFDLNSKWDNGQFVGPATELKGGFVVRDCNGRYLTTMHMKTNLVDVDKYIKPEGAEAILPAPLSRVKTKSTIAQGDDGDMPLPTRDSESGGPPLGPEGEVVVPKVGDMPLPTRDSKSGGPPLGPEGEVVAPEPLEREGSGAYDVSRVPGRRIREKSRLMAMRPLTLLEQEIEQMAVNYDVDEQYDEEAVLRIYEMLERTRLQGSKAVIRKSTTSSTSWTTGMFTHGGVSGLRTTTTRLPSTTAFLVKAAKELTGSDKFAVVAITHGAKLRAHRGSHNEAGSENAVIALTDFNRGGIWIEGRGVECREVLPGRVVQGGVQDLELGSPVFFNPRKWHETQDFEGDRVVMMTYTPRTTKLNMEDKQRLRELGFNVPERDPGLHVSSKVDVAWCKQQLVVEAGEALVSCSQLDPEVSEEDVLDGALLRTNEYQQQMLEEMLDRSALLQDLLEEEEEERLDDLRSTQVGCLETARQAHGQIMQVLDNLAVKIKKETQRRDETESYYLPAISPESVDQDYEKLLEGLQEDLQVTHTVPLCQVKPVAEKWGAAIQKEISNLFNTGTLKRVKMSQARRMEAEGRLRLVPGKGVRTIKPPAEKGHGFKRKYRLVLCGNFVDPSESQGSLYAGGVGAESLRTLLAATTSLGWLGATTDIVSAFIQAEWPEGLPMYAVVPPRLLLQELEYAEDGEAWLVCRPLYGLRESPSIWANYRNERLRTLKIPYVDGFITLQQSKTDSELWYAVDQGGDLQVRGSLLALIITYVDDLFYMGPEKIVKILHEWVHDQWPCSELQWASVSPGVRYLGMEIFQRETGEYEVTQNGYIMDLIRGHDMLEAPQTLPCPKEWITDNVDTEAEEFSEADLRLAQRLVGEQLWLAMRCRPDVHFTVSYMASWVARHPRRVTKIAYRMLAYLHKTAGMRMVLVVWSIPHFITVEDSPVSWRCGKQTFVMLSIMESELYQATEAAVLLENVGVLLDELAQFVVPRTLCVDNSAATAMILGGPGSWRTRHLKVRSAYLIQRVQEKKLHVEHVDGVKQRADLSTKVHSKARLYALLKLWRFEQFPQEAATATDTEDAKDSVKIAGVDELVFVTILACAAAILAWEIVKAVGKQLWICFCRPVRGRKAKKLRDLARAAAEAEVDKALSPEPKAVARQSTLGAMSSTAWFPSSLEVRQRSIATQTEDWIRVSAPVVVTLPRQVRSTIQDDDWYVHFDGPFFRSEYGDTVHVNPNCNIPFTRRELMTDLPDELSVLRTRGSVGKEGGSEIRAAEMAGVAAEGNAAAHAATPVPDDDDLQEPPDPWRDYVAGRTDDQPPPPGFSPARRRTQDPGSDHLAGFEEFLRRRGALTRQARRRAVDDDDDGEEETGGSRSNAGPPPQWDGTTAFRDYEIRARLWLATTKVKAKARGPSLLRNLSGTPFGDLKHLAKDEAWMQSDDNGNKLIQMMNTKELYGEDEREEMINTLVKVTYTLRRGKSEGYKTFFARWDNAVRKLGEHKVDLPQEYLGFLLVMALQVTPDEVKLMMNYTQGKLTQKAVKEWIRVQEADLAWNASGQKPKKVESIMMMDEATESYVETVDEDEPEEENLEVLLNALGDLDNGVEGESTAASDVFDEEEAKEILATMVKEYSKGGFRRSFKAVNDAKRAKGLARGYGAQKDPSGRFGPAKGQEPALKKKTRCANCRQIGHWHRECPNPQKPKDAHYLENGSEEVLFLHYLDFLDSKKEQGSAPDRMMMMWPSSNIGPTPQQTLLASLQALTRPPCKMQPRTKRTREEKAYKRQFHWRRMVLWIFTVVVNSVYRMVAGQLDLQLDRREQMVETLRGMNTEELEEAQMTVESAILTASHQEDKWSVVEPGTLPSPRKRPMMEEETGSMSWDEFAPTQVNLCHCNLETVMLRTKKRRPKPPSTLLKVPSLRRPWEPMRILGERREPGHVAANPEEWTFTFRAGQRADQCQISGAFLSELGMEHNESPIFSGNEQPGKLPGERLHPGGPGGGPMWLRQSSSGRHWVQCLGDPDQVRTVRQGDATQGDGEGQGALREDQPGAAHSQYLASDATAAERRVHYEADGNSSQQAPLLRAEPGEQFERGLEEEREMKLPIEGAEQPREKRSRIELLEIYHMDLTTLANQRQKKEARPKDFVGQDRERLDRAILKEINNNLETGAYKILTPKESYDILRNKPEKVMESRYVLTKKPLEPSDVPKAQAEGLLLDDQQHGPVKAKCRHVMKGFSEESALDVESTTPQVNRDSVIFITGEYEMDQILKLLKTCYGLTDGPYAWYQHFCRRLCEMGYQTSRSDPCVFFLHGPTDKEGGRKLEGVIGLATNDMLHGGDQRHWDNIEKIATEYKLGKNQKGEFYVKEKAEKINIPRKRKQQRFSRRTAEEVEQLRSQLGVLSWLAKETRCDIAGRVCLLQQCFPEPKVSDLIECNKILDEAIQHCPLGIKVMPIDWKNLRVSVVTDAAWGNSREQIWIENSEEDFWEETDKEWVRHHKAPRRTSFHPGAAQGGPNLHHISAHRRSEMFINQEQAGIKTKVAEDTWNNDRGIRVLNEDPWCGVTRFRKCSSEEPAVQKIHSSLQQLQNLSSQGGQIILYHDKALAEGGMEAQATLAPWKSFRLKRKTVDTLAAEGQSLQSGIGSIHWHRLLFLEAFYGMMSTERWREESKRIPFLAAVDSKNLYDAANKCTSTTAYISDKRTAIDLAVIKADLLETNGTIRWIDTRAMRADPLTKAHPATYLRYVMSVGKWSIVEEGTALQQKVLLEGELGRSYNDLLQR